ncbi:MAG: (d)CMP kinase [Halanaerobiales bacterium]|nr:(d)CMP kinase [Halanaerobiales bacterium]
MSTSIAIDGPAGAGKSTIAKMLAEKLNYTYLDSGAMYRAVTYLVFDNNVDIKDNNKIIKLTKSTDIDIDYSNNEFKIFIDNKDISDQIRSEVVDKNVSTVAQIKGVRDELVKKQRKIANSKNIVMDGRDIGTRVLPNSDYKFYITATVKERANRRYQDILDRGVTKKSLEEVKNEIVKRDKIDSNRKYSPLKKADDSIVVDTTMLSKKEVLQKLLSYIKGE